MNAISAARVGYSDATPHTRSARNVEYEVISRVTRLLKKHSAPRADYGALIAALHKNRQLWTLLAADVSGAGNGLPKELRARIFFLSEFVRDHSRKVLRGTGEVAPLIEINLAILRGLTKGDAS